MSGTSVWSDVRFDQAAADDAVAACEGTAVIVDRVLQGLAAAGFHVHAWTGNRREEFDAEVERITAELDGVVEDARAVAAAIAAGAQSAAVEQSRREARREELRAEAAARGGGGVQVR